jgi:predicted metal-dependent peptidase
MLQLLIKQPFYGHVAAAVTPVETLTVKTIKMASIPSLKLLYNPKWFAHLSDKHKIGVVLHELLHLILMHPYRGGQREPALWSIACDLAVNEYIDPDLLPEDSITVELLFNRLKLNLPRQKSAESYYNLLAQSDELVYFIGKDDEVMVAIDSDTQLKSTNLAQEQISQLEKKSLMSDLAQMMEEAGSEGEMPVGLQSIVDDVYQDFKVNWRNSLKRFLSGRGKIIVRKSYKRQSRRFDDLPGTKRAIGVNALVAIDESGSISDDLITKFYNELKSINTITGASIKVTRFDTECTEPIALQDYVKNKERLKSGGTDFRPVFQVADRYKIPLLIIFTDGDGIAPESSNQKTLWVITKGGKKPAAFGYYVVIEN